MLGEIILCMTIGTNLSPKDIVIAFAEGTQQTGQPDDGQISPSKPLAVGGVTKLVHTELATEDKAFPFAVQP